MIAVQFRTATATLVSLNSIAFSEQECTSKEIALIPPKFSLKY